MLTFQLLNELIRQHLVYMLEGRKLEFYSFKKCIVINDDGDVISSNFIPLKHFKLAIKKHAISNIEYF